MKRQKNGIWKLTDEEMTSVCIWASEAANWYDQIGLPVLARNARENKQSIYKTLDAAGLFDGL